MPRLPILALTLSLSAVLGRGISVNPRLDSSGGHGCMTWGGNATTGVFHGCCQHVALETYPALALTASCPNRAADYNATLIPDGLFTSSRLQLDQCLRLRNGQQLVTLDDVTPQEALGLGDLSTFCDPTSFKLIDEIPQLHGSCNNSSVSYPLDSLILSSRGILICAGFARGNASASLDDTCCDLSLDTEDADNPVLSAMCQTNRFRPSSCQDLKLDYFYNSTQEHNWRTTTIPLNKCLTRRQVQETSGYAGGIMQGHVAQDGCTWALVEGGAAVLAQTCGSIGHNYTLGDFVRNEYGTLACYDVWGT